VTTKKKESYRLAFTEDMRRLVVDLNAILARLEDRLDQIEGLRIGYATNQTWEKDHLKEVRNE